MIDLKAKIDEHIAAAQALREHSEQIEALAGKMLECLQHGGKILWMGNGGSAADCQHLAAELVGRFSRDRAAIASIALTTDTSALTAVSNDFGYEQVFARQVAALCRPEDFVIGISTSGNSENVLLGLRAARQVGAQTAALTGQGGGALRDEADTCLMVPATDTARIQECHILVGHLLCDWIEQATVES